MEAGFKNLTEAQQSMLLEAYDYIVCVKGGSNAAIQARMSRWGAMRMTLEAFGIDINEVRTAYYQSLDIKAGA